MSDLHVGPGEGIGPLVTSGSSSSKAVPLVRFPWRALLIGLLLVPAAAYWASDQGIDVILSLMVPPVALTLFVVILNTGVGVMRPKWRLREGEMVMIYAILSVATAMSAEWSNNITPLIYTYGLYADTGNNWQTVLLPKLPSFLFIKDPTNFQDFKQGGKDFSYFLAHLHLWWVVILSWTLIVFLLAFAMLCINNLMREEWTQREKLSFPIIQLPIALTEGGGSSPIWTNLWFRAGFAIFFITDLINGIHFLIPSIPLMDYRFVGDVHQWLPSMPFSAIGWTPIGIFPFIVAIGMFLPTDLLFSVIFFFFFRKFEQIIAATMGYTGGVFGGGGLVPSPPYFSEQTWGAFIGLFVMAIWVARGYLKELWVKIRTNSSPGQRWAFIGLLVCLMGLMVICQLASLPPLFMLIYLIVFLGFSVVLTRMRAELGPPTHEMAFMGPNQLMVDLVGTRGASPTAITNIATIFYFANRLHRSDPMPSQLEAMKMGERSRVNPGYIFSAVAAAILVGALCGHLVRICLGYRWGGGHSGEANAAAGIARDLLNKPRDPNGMANLFMVFGFLMVVGLNILRFRMGSFPLNPVGYALAMNFGVDYYWFGLLVALLIKLCVQRYVGLKGYSKLHTFALGVILGEFAAEAIWSTVSMVFRIATYSISINGRLGWDQ